MPTVLDEVLVELFRNRPELAAELVGDVLGHPLPSWTRAAIADGGLGQRVQPEHRVDLVVLLATTEPRFCIAVEVQRRPDPDKRFVWPLYAAALRARHRCPACVLVIAPDRKTAAWAARPIDTGQPDSPFRPLVTGPAEIPLVAEADQAIRSPELALLSVQAHGRGEHGFEVAEAAMQAAAGLDEERAQLYLDVVYAAVTEAVRRELEGKLLQGYQYQTEFVRKLDQQRREAIARAEAEGRAQGEAEGRAQGEAEGRISAILKVVERRGLSLDEDQRARLMACTDLDILDAWLDRALEATTAAGLFDVD